jgi:hypothetical protein
MYSSFIWIALICFKIFQYFEGRTVRNLKIIICKTIIPYGHETQWRGLHNEFHNVCPSPSIIRILNSRKMRLARRVA